jgi:hypothetical protein
VGLALWPCAYQGIEAQPAPGGAVQERQLCATLVEANGVDVLGVLALPVLLAGVGLVAVRTGRRGILFTVMVALVAFCLLEFASVGLFYAPAAAALVIAVSAGDRSAAPRPTADHATAASTDGYRGPEPRTCSAASVR